MEDEKGSDAQMTPEQAATLRANSEAEQERVRIEEAKVIAAPESENET